MEEKKIEQALIKAVTKLGGIALKLANTGTNGYPDRLVLIALGKVAFVEVKAPNEDPRKLQLKRHKKLRELGFKVFVLDDQNQIGGIIDEIRTT